MIPENIIAYIAVLIQLVGVSFYIKDMYRGTTKPNLVSWTIWALAPLIGSFFLWKAGAGFSILPVFMAGFGPLVVIIVSFWKKNAYFKISKLDIFCGIFALLALVFYVLTHNLGISIFFAILSDGLAAVPTIIKSWKFPETETASVYLPGIINNVLALLIIRDWSFTIYSFSLYLVIVNVIIIFILYRKRIFPNKIIS